MEDRNKPAAQPQGDPVAHCLLRRNGSGEWVNDAKSWVDGAPSREIIADCEKHPELYRVRLAYAERPAPVAVVLSGREAMSNAYSACKYHAPHIFEAGWNACLDELKRLNTPRPTHANPPPGTEPSGTHHDNDGLDEMRKPDSGKDRRAELLESLAKQVYDSWESQPGFVPWVDGGNSLKQDEARQIASRTFELALANQVGD